MIVNISENASLFIPDKYENAVNDFVSKNKNLPLQKEGKNLTFGRYIVGSLKIDDLVININPRINNLTINHYFEMQLYNEGLLDEKVLSLLDENKGFGVQESLIALFLNTVLDLVTAGVEGEFTKNREETSLVHGKILAHEITPLNLFQDKLPIEYEVHGVNTTANKIIKLALDKVKIIEGNSSRSKLPSIINPYFEQVDADSSNLQIMWEELKFKHSFVNVYYSKALGLAKKILDDLKINFRKHETTSSSYLVNSNSIFENYARKVLKDGLRADVTKWNKPKKIGQFTLDGETIEKSYQPDVLIEYNNDLNVSLAVIDVKNKDISSLSDIGSLSDLYQIIFYSSSLDASYGGLIYPAYKKIMPTKVSIDSLREVNLFVFGIDFSVEIHRRNKQLIKDIRETFNVF